jgi:hypothetical protein
MNVVVDVVLAVIVVLLVVKIVFRDDPDNLSW